MKRRLISMLAAMALLATASAPGVVYAEGDVDMTVSTEGSLQTKGDGESGSLDSILDANASIMGALGSTSWTIRAESVQKTGKWRDDMVAVAQSQVGYTQEADGATIYGEWMGEQSAAWDALFVSWVAEKAGLTEKQFPHGATYDALVEKLTKYGAVKTVSKANYPNTGDIALLKIGEETRMGVIAYVSGGYAAVICGSDNGAVTRETYQIDGKAFKSYADMNVLMSRAGLEVSKGDEVTIPEGGVAAWTNTDSVYMRKEPTTASKKVTMVKKSGTALLVTSAEKQEDGYVWYGVTYKEYTGYIRGDLIKLDEIEQPAATEAPKAAACVICGANGEQDACLYAALASKSAEEAYAFLLDLLENDRAAFNRYVNCHDAHVAQGAPAVICGNGCTQTLTNLTAPGAAHSASCPWHAEKQLGVEERVVNIKIVQVDEGQSINITFDVYGATGYQWYRVETPAAGNAVETKLPGETNPVLTVTAKTTDGNWEYSYYCVAEFEDKTTVKSKTTKVDVIAAPVVAEAILGEEVKFTYTNAQATAYQWYIYDAEKQTCTFIDPTDLTYIGANSSMLAFYATEDKAANIYVCKAFKDGAEVSTSAQYQLSIQKADLCKYVEELANMTPTEREVALTQTWNITLNGENLAEAVEAHWLNCENGHRATYPDLFAVDGVTAAGKGNVRPNDTTGTAGIDVFTDCNALQTECELIQSWIATKAAPLTIYSEMQALMSAPGYTANGEKYDRLFALMVHVENHPEVNALLCTCGATVADDDWHPVAPGPDHAENCPWHSEYKEGLNECVDENGETYFVLALKGEDGTLSDVAHAVRHPKEPDHYYLKDNKTGLYVAYLDDNGNIVPLKSKYDTAD